MTRENKPSPPKLAPWAGPPPFKQHDHPCDTQECKHDAAGVCDCGQWACVTCQRTEHTFCYPDM